MLTLYMDLHNPGGPPRIHSPGLSSLDLFPQFLCPSLAMTIQSETQVNTPIFRIQINASPLEKQAGVMNPEPWKPLTQK